MLPGLRVLDGSLHERLSARWPQAVTADYPALARPGSAQVQVPDFWQPEGVSGQAGPAGPAITMVAECSLMPMSGSCTALQIAFNCILTLVLIHGP